MALQDWVILVPVIATAVISIIAAVANAVIHIRQAGTIRELGATVQQHDEWERAQVGVAASVMTNHALQLVRPVPDEPPAKE